MRRQESNGLAVRIGTAMVLVSLTAISLACVLAYFRFEETYRSLAVQRLQLTAGEIARVLQSGLDLGLPVEEQGTVTDILGQQMSDHPDIAEITVSSCEGRVLFQEGAAIGAKAVGAVDKPAWSSSDADRLVVGRRVSDSLGGCAAGVEISRDAGPLRRAMVSVAERYAVVGGLAAAATVLAMIVAALLFSRRRPLLAVIGDDLDDLLEGRAERPSVIRAAGGADQPWESRLSAAYDAARPALVGVAKARERGAG